MWQRSDNGRMGTLDTAAQLAVLRQRVDHLLDRLAVNTLLTAAGLGSLDPAKLPNGYSLQSALDPLDSLVAGMPLSPPASRCPSRTCPPRTRLTAARGGQEA
ncbi:hypothetical protein [Streptomyces sp. NPDC004014]